MYPQLEAHSALWKYFESNTFLEENYCYSKYDKLKAQYGFMKSMLGTLSKDPQFKILMLLL